MAAAILILYLPYFLEFLLLVRDKKENRSFNHMEQNVFEGLKDIPTLTELCVLALYAQAISHPYMRVVRGSGNRRINAIELGPFHKRVTAHCRAIIADPNLLLGADCDYMTGALDGKNWEQPEVLYAVQQLSGSLPHLTGCLVSFFEGALETWERFSSEFEEEGVISQLSQAEKDRVFIQATNDHNEGALGSLRQTWRRAPSMTIAQHNARTMYKQNNTRSFMQSNILSAADKKYIRSEARHVDSSGQEKQMRQVQAKHDQHVAEEHRKVDAAKKEKADAIEAQLDNITPHLDLEWLKSSGRSLTVTDIMLELNWHRRYVAKDQIPPKTLIRSMKKEDKLNQLIIAVERYNSLPQQPQQSLPLAETLGMEWEEADAIEDADMEDGLLLP
jgi:hypothetical protein